MNRLKCETLSSLLYGLILVQPHMPGRRRNLPSLPRLQIIPKIKYNRSIICHNINVKFDDVLGEFRACNEVPKLATLSK